MLPHRVTPQSMHCQPTAAANHRTTRPWLALTGWLEPPAVPTSSSPPPGRVLSPPPSPGREASAASSGASTCWCRVGSLRNIRILPRTLQHTYSIQYMTRAHLPRGGGERIRAQTASQHAHWPVLVAPSGHRDHRIRHFIHPPPCTTTTGTACWLQHEPPKGRVAAVALLILRFHFCVRIRTSVVLGTSHRRRSRSGILRRWLNTGPGSAPAMPIVLVHA